MTKPQHKAHSQDESQPNHPATSHCCLQGLPIGQQGKTLNTGMTGSQRPNSDEALVEVQRNTVEQTQFVQNAIPAPLQQLEGNHVTLMVSSPFLPSLPAARDAASLLKAPAMSKAFLASRLRSISVLRSCSLSFSAWISCIAMSCHQPVSDSDQHTGDGEASCHVRPSEIQRPLPFPTCFQALWVACLRHFKKTLAGDVQSCPVRIPPLLPPVSADPASAAHSHE